MKAPELSQEMKGDLQVLKMRGSMDPKRFYKKNDRDGFPKYFQVGAKKRKPHKQVPNFLLIKHKTSFSTLQRFVDQINNCTKVQK